MAKSLSDDEEEESELFLKSIDSSIRRRAKK